jgi:signal transduction histidine kinase
MQAEMRSSEPGCSGSVAERLSRRGAVLLTTILTAAYALLDFVAPGEINVSILYATSVVAASWTRSRLFLWSTAGVCIVLAYLGIAWGHQPTAPVVASMYINRSFVVAGLVLIAAIVHRRMRLLARMEQLTDLQARQNEALGQARDELRRANDELESRVAREVNRRIETEQSLHQAQKMEALGQLTGSIAHDFNNVLTTVIGNLDLIEGSSASSDPRRSLAEKALRGAEQGSRLVTRLLSFARRQPLEPKVLGLDRVLGEVEALAAAALGHRIGLLLKVDPDLWHCCADQGQLEAAILNLVFNSRDAIPGDGRIILSAKNVQVDEDAPDLFRGDYVQLSVSDTGLGMPAEVAARAFEPFYTTKGETNGTGLGLSSVFGFAKQTGGTARIESTPGDGTTVYLYLPRSLLRASRPRRPL